MKIRSLVIAGATVFLASSVVLSGALFMTFNRMNVATERIRLSNEVVQGVFEQNLITSDYLLHPGDRARTQQSHGHVSLSTILNKAEEKFRSSKGRVNLDRLRNDHNSTQAVLAELPVNCEGNHRCDADVISHELVDRMTLHLLSISHSMATDAHQLAEVGLAEVSSTKRSAALSVAGFLLVIVVLIGLTMFAIIRRVLWPISQLQKESEIIGAGNLEYRTGINSSDEIGALSRAFDQMKERLKATTVSRDILAKEVEQRQRAEQDLANQAQELARSNQELEQFAHIASHDLQEPLRMVSSYTQLLERRYKDKLDSDANEFIGYAVDGARRMQTQIKDLLSYSRVTTQANEIEATDCSDIFEKAVANLTAAIDESGAVVTRDTLPVAVPADASQLLSVFQNLIGNSIKYHSDQPPCIHVSAEETGPEWKFSFKDNGIGIDSEFTERIFQLFQRLHNKTHYAGTGIGLAVCKKVIERHRGRIWVESEPRKGSTFYFTLPMSNQQEKDQDVPRY